MATAAAAVVSVSAPRVFPLVSLVDFFERFYRPERLAAAPPSTIEQYRIQFRHLDRYRQQVLDDDGADGPLTIGHLSRENILGARAWLIETGRSVASANKFARHAAALWRFGIEEELIDEPPRPIRRLKEPKRKARAWKLHELAKILGAARQVQGDICGIRGSRWWCAFLLLLYDTGLRISTAMDLRWEFFNAQEGELRIPAELVKDDEELVHELSTQTLSALLAMRGSGAAELFPWPYDSDRKWRALRKHHRRILRSVGLPWKSRRDGGFHKYRATTASYLKRGGGDSTEHLGHSTPAVTAVYLDRTICRPRQVDLLPRPKLADPDPQMRLF